MFERMWLAIRPSMVPPPRSGRVRRGAGEDAVLGSAERIGSRASVGVLGLERHRDAPPLGPGVDHGPDGPIIVVSRKVPLGNGAPGSHVAGVIGVRCPVEELAVGDAQARVVDGAGPEDPQILRTLAEAAVAGRK